MEKEIELFERAPVPKAVFSFALPTIITQLINIIYNYADTYFVGRTGDPAMMAAMSVCFPIFVIGAAVANFFGVGGSSVISRSMGQKNYSRARQAFAFCFWAGMLASVVYGALIFVLRVPLAPFIGGDDASAPYIYDYLFWTCVVGAIPTIGNMLMGHLIRSKGYSKIAGFGMSAGGILNIFLDPLFMFVILPEGQEVRGAALATLCSNIFSFLFFLIYLLKHREDEVFCMEISRARPEKELLKEVCYVGLPAALQTTMAMVSNIFANALVAGYGSEAVAGMGVAKKINSIAFNTCMGLSMGIIPLVGYTYGAGMFKRMKKTVLFTGAVGVGFGFICLVVFRRSAAPIIRFFIDEDLSVSFGKNFLSVIAFAAPLAALTYLSNTVFQATGKKWQAFLLAITRKGIVDIPLMFVFSGFFGAFGVVMATPVAEILSATLAVGMMLRFFCKMEG